ncbi:MAG TPA: TSUP family transporter, partial [Herpetosiphonaceae bacterium]
MIDLPTVLLAPLLGALIGLALGMLGGGGSILTVPMLVYILRQDPHIAVATSLVIVGANALTGAWLHYRAGHVRLKPALLFGLYGIPVAYGAARLSTLLSGPLLLVLFALLMLVIA